MEAKEKTKDFFGRSYDTSWYQLDHFITRNVYFLRRGGKD